MARKRKRNMIVIRPGSYDDSEVSGVKISVSPSCIHLDFIAPSKVTNRDFFFNNDGTFDGTGTFLDDEMLERGLSEEELMELA